MKASQGTIVGILFLLPSKGSSSLPDKYSWKRHAISQKDRNDEMRFLQLNGAGSEVCAERKNGVESSSIGADGTPLVTCSCKDFPDTNTTTLNCINGCEYCDSAQRVCGIPAFGEVYDDAGMVISDSDSFAYTKGRSEVVNIRQFDCMADIMGNVLCQCQVLVSGEECNSCQLSVCASGVSSGSALPSINCTNLEEGAVYDLCDESLVVPSTSVFAFLSNEPDDFVDCLLEGDTYTPTAAISEEPSMIPSDAPSLVPSGQPSVIPSDMPSLMPSVVPTVAESMGPSSSPTQVESMGPTETASFMPSIANSTSPTAGPTPSPTPGPTVAPTPEPTAAPTSAPTEEDDTSTKTSSAYTNVPKFVFSVVTVLLSSFFV